MSTDALDKLSDMQVACLRLVAELKKTEQIAAELGISPSTVNTHIERAIARLQVPNRREAARLVVSRDREIAIEARAREAGRLLVTEPDTREASELSPATTAISRPEKQPTEDLPLSAPVIPLQSPTASTTAMGRRRNDLTTSQRLLLAVFALVLLCVGLGGLGAAIEKLSNWRAAHGARR